MNRRLVNRQENNMPAVNRHTAQEVTGEQATGEPATYEYATGGSFCPRPRFRFRKATRTICNPNRRNWRPTLLIVEFDDRYYH